MMIIILLWDELTEVAAVAFSFFFCCDIRLDWGFASYIDWLIQMRDSKLRLALPQSS